MEIVNGDTLAVQRILAERARVLAQQETQADQSAGEEMVVFRLGASNYAVAARWVRELYPLRAYTALPTTPAFVVGLANVRSQLLAVIDIRPLLNEPRTPPPPEAIGIILHVEGDELTLLAETVAEVRASDQELMGLVSQQTGRAASWVRGLDQRLNIVIDAPRLLSDPRLVVDTEAGDLLAE